MQGVWRETGRIRTTGATQTRSCVCLALEPTRGTTGMLLRYYYNKDGYVQYSVWTQEKFFC